MKRNTAIKVLTGLVVVFSMAAFVLLIPAEQMVPFLYGKRLGGIEQKRIETEWVLKKYEITGFPGETRDWLTRYHGEAPGQEVFYAFVDWGLKHPKGFVEITEGIVPEKRQKLVHLLAMAIIDNGDDEQFSGVFGESKAHVIQEVRVAISEQKLP